MLLEKTTIPFGYMEEGKLYLQAWANHPTRIIGEVQDNDLEKSIAFFTERYNDLCKKVNETIAKMEEDINKGSFLMKLLHLKEQLPKHDGLGDYQTLYDTIVKHETLIKDIIQKNRIRNTEIKTALIEETKQGMQTIINWKKSSEQINEIKTKWIKTGKAETEKNEELEKAFWELIEDFYDRKRRFYEDKQKIIDIRKKQYEELVSAAEKIDEYFGKPRVDRIKELRAQWKQVGGVPNSIFIPLFKQFNTLLTLKKETPSMDYGLVLSSLLKWKESKEPMDREKLELFKKNALLDKNKNNEKKHVLELIQLLTEREFIDKLARKKVENFAKLNAKKKKNIYTRIVKDLLLRDKENFNTYEENSSNFSCVDAPFNKLISNKLKSQERKIKTKEKLLEWIENDEF